MLFQHVFLPAKLKTMKTICVLLCASIFLLSSCGGFSGFGGAPSADRSVYEQIDKLAKAPGDSMLESQFTYSYAQAVNRHKSLISQYETSTGTERWERIMNEYAQLNRLADAVAALSMADRLVKVQRYDDAYQQAKTNAVEALYSTASNYLNSGNRTAAQQAYSMLRRANELAPGYKDVQSLMAEASRRSTLNIVINPVNYYAQSYNYWGLNNDYVQYQLTNDLRYQLGTGSIKVYTDREAYSNNIYPDRVVDLSWNEIYMPVPVQRNYTRQVSQRIQTGQTEDKQPIYTTVTATLFITQVSTQARGTLSCRIIDPATNRTLLYENYPGGYNRREEYATYRGDSRALSNYDWAMVNRGRYTDPTRGNLFNEVLQQVYPRLISSIRSVTWYS